MAAEETPWQKREGWVALVAKMARTYDRLQEEFEQAGRLSGLQ